MLGKLRREYELAREFWKARRDLAPVMHQRKRWSAGQGRISFGRGSYAYGGATVIVHNGDPAHGVTVGNYTSIAEDVTFLIGGEHHTDWFTTFPFSGIDGHPVSRGPIVVGNDVWIGMGAIIRSGVRIGDGAVIGMRSVVTTDVEPYTVVAGVPAKPRRKRFDEETVEALLALKWWDWPEDAVMRAVPALTGGTIDDLRAAAPTPR